MIRFRTIRELMRQHEGRASAKTYTDEQLLAASGARPYRRRLPPAGLLTPSQAARRLGFSERTLWRRVHAGRLAAVRRDGRTGFEPAEVERLRKGGG